MAIFGDIHKVVEAFIFLVHTPVSRESLNRLMNLGRGWLRSSELNEPKKYGDMIFFYPSYFHFFFLPLESLSRKRGKA